MPVWILTITNATEGQLAFSATKDGSDKGSFTQVNSFARFNISSVPGRSDLALAYNANGTPGDSVGGNVLWQKDGGGIQEFPVPGTGFNPRDCIIIINATNNPATTALLSVGSFSNQGFTIERNDSVAAGDMIFAVIPNNALPRFTDKPCCVHPDTLVLTKDGQKAIKNLKKGDIVIDVNGKEVELVCNAKGVTTKKFVNIPESSLGVKVPSQDLLIKEEHPILIEGKETTPRRLMKKAAGYQLSDIVLKKAEHVYTLCTKDRHFIMMNNIPVSSWGEQAWEKYTTDNPDMFWISQ